MAVVHGVLTQFELWVTEKYGVSPGEAFQPSDRDFQEFVKSIHPKMYTPLACYLEPIDVREQPFNWQEVYT